MKLLAKIERGEYLIIRVDGSETRVKAKPTLDALYKAIGCDGIDSVILAKDEDGAPTIAMIVDDTGMVDHKPLNPRATELYHAKCGYVTQYSIHGDVVILDDRDFE